jgi:DNA-binding winged helix-turn-helix (wHTH) protein/Tol biopolymer transport system component
LKVAGKILKICESHRMPNGINHLYEFGPFRADAQKRLLLRDSEPVPLTPKAFDILLALLERHGEVLSKEELMQAVWPDVAVEENNLTRNISTLRKALGERPDEHRYVVTLPGSGYRFVAAVKSPVGEGNHSKATVESITALVEPVVPEPPAANTSRLRDGFGRWLTVRQKTAAMALVLLGSAALGIGGLTYRNGTARQPARSAQPLQAAKLTHTGNALWPTLSPDGKYVAYVLREAAGQSILLKHLDTNSAQQILPPLAGRDLGLLNFSPDGNQLYFVKSDTLHRLPVLGGVPIKLLTDLGGYAISADGQQLAFIRHSRQLNESALMIANTDGTAERKLAARNLSAPYRYVAWSPDGKFIAASVGSSEIGGPQMYPVAVRVADGAERVLTARRWGLLGEIAWSADGSGVITCGIEEAGVTSSLWHVSAESGAVRQLNSDTNNYGTFKLAAPASLLVASTAELQTQIWTAPLGKDATSPAAQAKQLTTGTGNYAYHWLPDNRILFSSSAYSPHGQEMQVMNADGAERRQIANTGPIEAPAVSTDGRSLVFASARAGRWNLWRMQSDGGNLQPLTSGKGEKGPALSPDGAWVIYTAADEDRLWKLPLTGGTALPLTGKGWRGATISSDGKWIASFYKDPQQPHVRTRIGVMAFADGAPVKWFEFPPDVQPNHGLRWMPDGQSLVYAGKRHGFWNLWRQALAGGAPVPLTDFKSTEEIFSFAWSPDGQQIVFTRGDWVFDVVLLRAVGE